MSHARWLLCTLTLALALLGCESSIELPPVDSTGPQVRLAYPNPSVGEEFIVESTVTLYLAAFDDGGIETVEALYALPGDPARFAIGSTGSPVPKDEIPEEIAAVIDLEPGWSMYTLDWSVEAIVTGEHPQVFARAHDVSGNVGISRATTVRVINPGGTFAIPEFRIHPPKVVAGRPTQFDPSLTWDQRDSAEEISVRWDFDGDLSRWEIDWNAGATAADIQEWTFENIGDVVVRLQAKNSYFPRVDDPVEKLIRVRSSCGDPRPPIGMEFAEIPAGTYSIGSSTSGLANTNEAPVHQVRMTYATRVQMHEVSNLQYLRFLEESMRKGTAVLIGRRAYGPDAGGSLRLQYLDLNVSRIFLDLDNDQLRIADGYEDHPVTGVSWYGASAFAEHYCLRLPTESEWEIAARGDHADWNYPYGIAADDGGIDPGRRINYVDSGDRHEPGTTPVGFFDGSAETVDTPGPWRIYDLVGNVSEWVLDWYGPYRGDLVSVDPKGPTAGRYKVVRGGSYISSIAGTRVSRRDGDHQPDDSFPTIGFRTAYTAY